MTSKIYFRDQQPRNSISETSIRQSHTRSLARDDCQSHTRSLARDDCLGSTDAPTMLLISTLASHKA
ncbi:hypothetical protein TB2_028315 [Malus domestica]